MFGDLFFKSKSQGEFHEEALAVLNCLNIGAIERRESAQHPPLEEYMRGKCLGLEVIVWVRDDAPEFLDYPYFLGVSARRVKVLSKNFCTDLADAIARELTLHGYEVVRAVNVDRPGSGRVVYTLDPDHTIPSAERVVTELVAGLPRRTG